MGRTTELRRAIKKTFVPYLQERGFSLDMRRAPASFTFRKIDAQAVYVCDIQWEKYGTPRFVVNFGKCGAQGVIVRGKEVMPGDIFPECTPEHGRLQPGRSRTTGGWFRQDRPLLKRLLSRSRYYPAEQVVAQLMALFAEVESFWISGTLGPHMHLSPAHPLLAVHNIGVDC
jgi:hypothetical protein